jgi:Tol biopolymer transport system component
VVLPASAQTDGGRSDEMWPRFSPDGTRIAYVSNRDGNFNLYVMEADGGSVVQLTDDPAWDSNISWSPDGEWIAFASARTGDGDIYTVRVDGSGLTRLTDAPEYEASPSWSPDGRQIIFTRRLEIGTEWSFAPFIMNADGSGQRNLIAPFWDADGAMVDGRWVWSPDGSQIALTVFIQRGEGADCINDGNVYILDAETGALLQAVSLGGGGSLTPVHWHAGGLTLEKRLDDSCASELAAGWYTLDLDERQVRRERFRGGESYYPSPDGEQVAFYGGNFERRQMGLGVASRGFTDARRLVVSPFYNAYGLDWSPDGRYVVGALCTETDADIYLLDTETGEAANLTAAHSETAAAPVRECGAYG